jgi:hypothetical protein
MAARGARNAYPWPPLASPPPPLATFDDTTAFDSEADVPELRDPASGRISETAAELRIAAAEAGAVVDSLPGMLAFQLPSRSTGSFFSGLFGSHYIPHGADPSGLCTSSAEHYRYLVLGLRITERYNALAPTPNARGADVELASSLLWLLWALRSVPRQIRSDLAAEGLAWAGPAFADYVCYLWDDLYADLHCHGAPVAELATPERIQRAAAAVVSLRAVAPPFAAGLADNATPRFAAVLLSALRASNAAAGSAVPLVPAAGCGSGSGSGSGSGTAGGRHARLAAELATLCAAVCGPRGSSDLAAVPGLDDAVAWAATRARAIRGEAAAAGRADAAAAAADLVDDVLRRPGIAAAVHTGRHLLSIDAEWPAWMLRRAGVRDDGGAA